MALPNATSEYTRQAVMTANPVKLVCLLYDGAIRFMEKARLDMHKGASADIGQSISRAYAIISELRVTLDPTAGNGRAKPIATELERLYTFVLDQLVKANIERSESKLNHALQVMKTLKEGWEGIARAA